MRNQRQLHKVLITCALRRAAKKKRKIVKKRDLKYQIQTLTLKRIAAPIMTNLGTILRQKTARKKRKKRKKVKVTQKARANLRIIAILKRSILHLRKVMSKFREENGTDLVGF